MASRSVAEASEEDEEELPEEEAVMVRSISSWREGFSTCWW